jgi:hypothetical protein
VKRPRIYGDEEKCRRALARYIKNGEELLDQADGVQKRMDDVPKDQGNAEYRRSLISGEWGDRFRKWFTTARPGMGQYLQDQYEDVLPVLSHGPPPDTGKPRHWIGLENGVPWLQQALDEMREMESALGGPVPRSTPKAPAASEKTRWFYKPWVTHPWISGIGTSLIAALIVWLIAR